MELEYYELELELRLFRSCLFSFYFFGVSELELCLRCLRKPGQIPLTSSLSFSLGWFLLSPICFIWLAMVVGASNDWRAVHGVNIRGKMNICFYKPLKRHLIIWNRRVSKAAPKWLLWSKVTASFSLASATTSARELKSLGAALKHCRNIWEIGNAKWIMKQSHSWSSNLHIFSMPAKIIK